MSQGAPVRSGRFVHGLSLIAGPVCFAASSLFWTGTGQYDVTGGTWLIVGSVFWIVGLAGIFETLEARLPRYSAWGFLAAVYGAVCGGAGFALQGLFGALYGVPHETALAALDAHPVPANVIFWIGGPAFPLSLLILGSVLARLRQVPIWAGTMLALGGALFPVARIPRLAAVAHGVDLLMLLPAAYMGWNMLRTGTLSGAPGR